jgi:hypothetical protein
MYQDSSEYDNLKRGMSIETAVGGDEKDALSSL